MKKYSILVALFLTACGGGGSEAPPIIAKPTTAPVVVTPSCTDPHTNSYPQSYNGYRPIPNPQQQLPTNYRRGISFKDYYAGGLYHSTLVRSTSNCSEDEYTKLMYTQALDEMKATGANMAWIYNYGPWDSSTTPWTVNPANYQMPERIVEFIVSEAKKRNIDIYYAWQFTTIDTNRNELVALGEKVTADKLNKILDAHHKQVIEMAKFAQRTGMKGISADWNAMHIDNLHDPELNKIYTEKFSLIIDDIRKNFSGEVTWGQGLQPFAHPKIVDKVDAVHISLGGPLLTSTENVNLSVEVVRDAIAKQIHNLHYNYNCIPPSNTVICGVTPSTKKVPVIFEIAVQSRDKYWTEGWVEDGFCVDGISPIGAQTKCVQETYVTDFSVQAIGIEGVLRAIVSQTNFTVKGVNFHTSYWKTKTLTAGSEGFPNLSQSIRGKPAEKIVKYWFTGT